MQLPTVPEEGEPTGLPWQRQKALTIMLIILTSHINCTLIPNIAETNIIMILKNTIIYVIVSIVLVSISGLVCLKSNNYKTKSLIVENLEALSDPEGGVTVEYCYEKVTIHSDKGSDHNLCESGTSLENTAPTTPFGTIYSCNSKGNSTVSITTKMGYCYKTK